MLSKILIMTLSIAAGERVSRKRASPIPDRLELTGSTPPNATLGSIDVALVSRDYPGLQGVIQDRSDPTSPRYAQWLTTEEVTAFVGATDEAIEKVGMWMRSVGLEPVLNNHKDILTAADAPAAKVEALLGARLHAYHDRVTSTVVHRIAGDYSIPSDIARHVAHVFPVHSMPVKHFGRPSMVAATSPSLATAADWPHDCKDIHHTGPNPYPVTPAVTRALYNYSSEPSTNASTIAALLPGPIGVDTAAITYVQSNCGLPIHKLDRFVGTNSESRCTGSHPSEDICLEASMDSQIIGTTAIGCQTQFWNGGEGSFISLFKGINDAGDAAPKVFSFSFGDSETDRDDDAPVTDRELAKSVAKGITLVCSSGDNGAHKVGAKFVANYPASSTYILSVGSTSLATMGVLTSGEVAVKEEYSSGGFSSLFGAPAWQSNFTANYLQSGVKMPSSGYTATGRGVPDIAALGGDSTGAWAVRFGRGSWTDGTGTSTSGPFIASLVAKLNAARLSKGKGTMGLLTPWLYSKAHSRTGSLRDVTKGCNGANPNGSGGTSGWCAAAGWDPVTGLGAPNYGLLEELALAA